jgi:hypothetical protein
VNPSNVRVEIPLLKGSRFGDRAIVSGNLLQSEIVRGKKECLYKSLLEKMCLKLSPPPPPFMASVHMTPLSGGQSVQVRFILLNRPIKILDRVIGVKYVSI